MQLDTAGCPDWGNGLPLEVLAQVARGRDLLKEMRLVNKSWQAGFEGSVTTMKVKVEGPLLPPTELFGQRFFALTSLDLGGSPVAEADLSQLAGLKRLRTLILGEADPDDYEFMSHGELQHWLKADRLFELLGGLPIQHLDLCRCQEVTSLEGLRGLALTSLDLTLCSSELIKAGFEPLMGMPLLHLNFGDCHTSPSLDSLRGLPLSSLGLKVAVGENLEVLRGWPLTSLNLFKADFSDEDLEPLRGLPLTDLNISSNRCVTSIFTGSGLEYLRNMPLSSLNLQANHQLLGSNLALLRGLPITNLDLGKCSSLSGESLAHLIGLPVQRLGLAGCFYTQNRLNFFQAIKHLQGLQLTELDLSDTLLENADLVCLTGMSELASLNLANSCISELGLLVGLPLTLLRLDDTWEIKDEELECLRTMPLTRLGLNRCASLTDACLGGLKEIKTLKCVE